MTLKAAKTPPLRNHPCSGNRTEQGCSPLRESIAPEPLFRNHHRSKIKNER